jgi:hypothetical protein
LILLEAVFVLVIKRHRESPSEMLTLLTPNTALVFIARTDLETVSSEEVWLDFSRKATLAAPRRVGAYDCEALQYTRPLLNGTEEQTWEICAARALSYFPIHQTARRNGHNSVLEFTNFETFDTAEGMIVIPTEITAKSWLNGEKLIKDERIEVTVLSVNESLDDSMFTLTKDEAQVVRFVDVPSKIRMDYEQHESQASWSTGSILWALGLIAMLALLSIAWLRSRKGKE